MTCHFSYLGRQEIILDRECFILVYSQKEESAHSLAGTGGVYGVFVVGGVDGEC